MNPNPNVIVTSVGKCRWDLNRNTGELRRPQNPASNRDEGSPSPSDNVSKPDIVGQSKLSVDAKEFVPRNFSGTEQYNLSLHPHPSHGDELQGSTNYQNAADYLLEMMEVITHSPGHFELLVTPIVYKLAPLLDDEIVVKELVSSILHQALMEQNFRYNGARLCCALCACSQQSEKSVFRKLLLSYITDMSQETESLVELEPSRVHGFIHFLGELYLQMACQKTIDAQISGLSSILLETLKVLVKTPKDSNVKTICGVFKLVGSKLTSEKPKEVDSCMSDLRKLLEGSRLEPRSKAILHNIFDLYKNNWGHASDIETQSSQASSSQNSIPSVPDEIVMYGPDGLELTAEERNFLNESMDIPSSDTSNDDIDAWDFGDDANPEVMAAFEEFLHEQKTRR